MLRDRADRESRAQGGKVLFSDLSEIVHLDAQASASATKHLDTLAYNSLLYRVYQVPVHSIVLLLRPDAQHANLTGAVQYAARPGRGKMDFGFEVVRLWEVPVEKLLAGGLATLPLAVLGKLPATLGLEAGLAAVMQQMVKRLEREAPPNQADRLLTAAFVLTGLRLPRAAAFQLFQGVRAVLICRAVSAATLYLTPAGDDRWSGTLKEHVMKSACLSAKELE